MRKGGWKFGALALALAALGGCSWSPRVGIGVGIPFTPIGFGVSAPLSPGDAEKLAYRPVRVETAPPGAEIYVNDNLVGSAPMTVQVPFAIGLWGQAVGSGRIVAKKAGYLSEGVQVFPAAGGRVATSPKGRPVDKLEVTLRPGS